jgi:phospholipase/carboxylesterase
MTLDAVRQGPATGKAEQLIVLLHGVGADGHDLIDLAVPWTRGLPRAAFLAPHAPLPYDGAPYGRQWFSILDRTPAVLLAGARRAAAPLLATVDAELARLGLGPEAVAFAGFSQGAMMALNAGLGRRPAPQAVLAYSGAWIPPEHVSPEPPPVLLVHGERDEVVPWQRSLDAERALRALGVQVETLWRPRLGHAIDEAGLATGGLFLQRAFSEAPVTRA